ncbi:oleate hydratase [Aspergillus unguis]
MDALLSLVPSPSNPNQTVRDEIIQHAQSLDRKTGSKPAQPRFLASGKGGLGRMVAKGPTLTLKDRIHLFMLASKTEKSLGRSCIRDFFSESFFCSGYWLLFATTFGFKPSHSAAEFRRYLHRFNNLDDLHCPRLLDCGKYNAHESVVAPIIRFLESQGVDFRFKTTICDITFAHDDESSPSEPTRVSAIQTSPARERSISLSPHDEKTIQLQPDDIVIVSLGSIFSSVLAGNNTRPASCLEQMQRSNFMFDFARPSNEQPVDCELDENWLLWLELCTKHSKFGNAYNFCTRVHDSRLESFTITLSSPEFFALLSRTTTAAAAATCDKPSPYTRFTLRDSAWLITLCIPPQPVFPGQPCHIHVCWGYALHPEKTGNYISKSMLLCSGKEVLTEILHHLKFPRDSILSKAITIPCIQPRAAAPLLPRTLEDDRPQVIPSGMSNMAVIGPFVDIQSEVVVTNDYSARSAQMAVRQLMGVGPPARTSRRSSALHLLGV